MTEKPCLKSQQIETDGKTCTVFEITGGSPSAFIVKIIARLNGNEVLTGLWSPESSFSIFTINKGREAVNHARLRDYLSSKKVNASSAVRFSFYTPESTGDEQGHLFILSGRSGKHALELLRSFSKNWPFNLGNTKVGVYYEKQGTIRQTLLLYEGGIKDFQ
jgi:hypothetical protein